MSRSHPDGRTMDDAAERAAARLVEAIGLGNRRRIAAGLAENARDFPRGAAVRSSPPSTGSPTTSSSPA
jgi:hypothetical protein